jgi:hypothetical protein
MVVIKREEKGAALEIILLGELNLIPRGGAKGALCPKSMPVRPCGLFKIGFLCAQVRIKDD